MDQKIERNWQCTVHHHWGISKSRPNISGESVDQISDIFSFQAQPRKVCCQASAELHILKSTVHNILHKKLKLLEYKIQVLQNINVYDYTLQYNFVLDVLSRNEENGNFPRNVIFNDESTFHVSGTVNCHNCRIWGSESSHATTELECNSLKVNVKYNLSHREVIGLFFFSKKNPKMVTFIWIC